jgi:hypothetical protein
VFIGGLLLGVVIGGLLLGVVIGGLLQEKLIHSIHLTLFLLAFFCL